MKKYILLGLCLLGSARQESASTQARELPIQGRAWIAPNCLPCIQNIVVKGGGCLFWNPDHSQVTRAIVEPGVYSWTTHLKDGKRLQYRSTVELSGKLIIPEDFPIEKVVEDTIPQLERPAMKRKSPSKFSVPTRKWSRTGGRLHSEG